MLVDVVSKYVLYCAVLGCGDPIYLMWPMVFYVPMYRLNAQSQAATAVGRQPAPMQPCVCMYVQQTASV